jgi:hypothetical protein
MPEVAFPPGRFFRTGYRVFVDDGSIIKTVDNPHYPRGETARDPLTAAEAGELTISRHRFELTVIGDGAWVDEPDPEDPTQTIRRLDGVVIGYDWKARDVAAREEIKISLHVRGAVRTEQTKTGLEGQVRFPPQDRRPPEDIAIGVEWRQRPSRTPTRTPARDR